LLAVHEIPVVPFVFVLKYFESSAQTSEKSYQFNPNTGISCTVV
jgi:hypothetical protein